ncbi:hypothetical protein LTR66_008778 [Elasticomyces elasticus]|nr:hypothetical protein LTR66_008778 [Elasticomyces elasticus]
MDTAVTNGGAANGRRDEEDTETVKTPKAPRSAPTGHKRSLSGSILSRLNFLRANTEQTRAQAEEDDEDVGDVEDTVAPSGGGAMAAAVRSTKSRKRKGSLRKAALLGGGKKKTDGRERIISGAQRTPSLKQATTTTSSVIEADLKAPPVSSGQLRRSFSYESPVAASSSDSGWSEPVQTLSLVTATGQAALSADETSAPSLASPISSPTNTYASTTDDDDGLTFTRPTNGPIPQNTKSSYFPPSHNTSLPLPRRRSTNVKPIAKPHSPLSALPMDAFPPEHSYSETERWGWVILVCTWIVFTIGMGSCLEVWSWAWDVGETPYAPPELEDDPTLPIVGYYPCLMVLGSVMAWVWVVVAWVGMKYFRHAKGVGEDG